MARVFVAMSGGVDSSVAAALLLEQGHEVTGVTMQLWPSSDEEGGCCSVLAIRDAKRVCDLLGIPHYALDFRSAFEDAVITPYVDAYARGMTPNPCVACNDRLKFADLLARVAAQGADALATGHYARIVTAADGSLRLARAVDPEKDQSYFLYRLTQAQMEHAMFPLGSMRKSDVRAVAERIGLHVHDKPESQDVCFAPEGHRRVIQERRPESLQPGPIVDRSGRVLGRHDGIAAFTVGQRHGLGLGGPDGPFYVSTIEAERNAVVVGPREALAVRHIEASDLIWHGSANPSTAAVQTRYRMAPLTARVHLTAETLAVDLDEPLYGVAPGQAVVCYAEDQVLGGGVIERTR